MKQKMGIIIAAVIGVLAAAYGIFFRTKRAVAVSIIGGADGPTSVFLAWKAGDGILWTLMVAGAVILLIVLILIVRKRK